MTNTKAITDELLPCPSAPMTTPQDREAIPELVGTLAMLPVQVKSVVESYGRACFAEGKRAALSDYHAQSKEQP